MLSFFPRDVLDEIWDLILLVSEGFPTYSCYKGLSFRSLYRVFTEVIQILHVHFYRESVQLLNNLYKFQVLQFWWDVDTLLSRLSLRGSGTLIPWHVLVVVVPYLWHSCSASTSEKKEIHRPQQW